MPIASQNETAWYREYWLKVAAGCVIGLAALQTLLLAALYYVIRSATLAAMNDYASQWTVK